MVYLYLENIKQMTWYICLEDIKQITWYFVFRGHKTNDMVSLYL
jgi:hypothetical protein